ncbi:SH3 domain-containing protein [Streptococcus equi subsp. zooepidemicus]|uniref:CHAP domain-containing protein n=1 Tax=Streptococcus equi TaxID=1336 RepID=UPI001E4B8706|nr:CHAP domain-containing protein [Streptococcus equi]MCD3432756.1 SH3 domain-containing protein [Streptococcus equi subsp. zooepidemicus]HEL0522822.1 SH3 domain-containing protein [Streptococcus equi subsp. zooepidemicus]HEL0695624.1 SH3 domain-containing protein [Streptococcus equi subsp. zooepidemicus]HEL0701499.1 SH3 domain-containing protein [Streptococcus equi subsp. zooepidemicus]HEL0707457.1 SH3 domain-containing protein [Streptococcus equi subsp. zooepidemicus]
MKKVYQLLTSGAILLGVNGAISSTTTAISQGQSGIVHAAVLGDNYPSKWKQGFGADPWNMYLRQCTSFVAFRLHSANGFSLPRGYGNAESWGHTAKHQGYLVDHTPRVGAVAWWDKGFNQSHVLYGHVAWVAEVNGDTVVIEEYNYNAGQGPEKYHKRQIHKHQVSGYIHFKDLDHNSTSHMQMSHASQAGPASLAKSGTYYFSNQSPIKAEATLASPDLAYYYTGQLVHYDQTLVADGYEWLSYIDHSGNRRYIPIHKLPIQSQQHSQGAIDKPKPVATTPIKVGDTVAFPGVFRVDQVAQNMIASSELAGGEPTSLNWIDPAPLHETDHKGRIAGNQILQVGDYFIVSGTYKVLKVDQPSRGIYVQMGSRGTWLTIDKAKKV